MDKKPKIPKEKKRNNEKRKEKSRNAARCRRSKESELYFDLASSLPFPAEQISQLDKASIMRLAISYLKIRNMIGSVAETIKESSNDNHVDTSVFLKTLDGFVMILSQEGDFIYLSENVNEYLGISQIDLMGQNVYDYSHPCDHEEIKEMLSGKECDDISKFKSLFIRMKCTLTTKGRSVTLKSAVYKVIHSTGHVFKYTNTVKNDDSDQCDTKTYFVAVSQPIPHPSNIESPLPKQTFLTKHNMDMKFTHADDELMKEILGYDSEDLLGKSVFDYHHAVDSECILSSYKCLFSKGQCQTGQYRFLAKTGGYVWLITQATLILDKNQKPQSVVCVNYVISELECKDEIFSASQYSTVKHENKSPLIIDVPKPVPEITITEIEEKNNNEVKIKSEIRKPISSTRRLFGNLKEVEGSSRPISATSTTFAPRTEDMNKGFLTFSDDEPGRTMLKDEPEDLTHLAPVAGDVCVPLEDHPFLPEMLDDILLRDNFGPLLNDAPTDPFISYRDYQDPSPQLLSPNMSKHSDCSLPSLSSPSDSLIDDDQSSFMNLPMDDVDLLKSPYTSMNISDEIPLLVSNDLMWGTTDKKSHQNNNSSLAQLLSTSINKQHKLNDHGGGLLQDHDMEEAQNVKNVRKMWPEQNNHSTKTSNVIKEERVHSTKRSNTNIYEYASKKTRNEPKEKLSSELLHQLISNNHNKGRPKERNSWLVNNGAQKAACVSQPSDSVLMNLLVDSSNDNAMNNTLELSCKILENESPEYRLLKEKNKRNQLLKNLLDPEATSIASLMDLTQQDYEVNAPVGNNLLQGIELLTALDANI